MKSLQALINFAGMTPHLLSGWNSQPVYVYQYDHVPPDKPDFPNYGAFHTSEVPFALGNLNTWNRPWRDEDRGVEKIMSSYWINFAKHGDPNGADLPEWEPYDKETVNLLRIGKSTSMESGRLKAALEFLEKHRIIGD